MKKILLMVILLLTGCKSTPIITQSPQVSTTAAAIKDSFEAARIDLADKYASALELLVTPPEKRIEIKPIYKDGNRVAVIPEKYRADNVVVVGTLEWSNLLKVKEVASQLALDVTNLNGELEKVREELIQQQQIKQNLAETNIKLTEENQKARAALFKRTAYLVGLLGLIGIYIYLKISKVIALPI